MSRRRNQVFLTKRFQIGKFRFVDCRQQTTVRFFKRVQTEIYGATSHTWCYHQAFESFAEMMLELKNVIRIWIHIQFPDFGRPYFVSILIFFPLQMFCDIFKIKNVVLNNFSYIVLFWTRFFAVFTITIQSSGPWIVIFLLLLSKRA